MPLTITINEAAPGTLTIGVGTPGVGVPNGGGTGTVLKKLSGADYDTGWASDISGVAWGAITGTLSTQTDLQTALNLKLDSSTAASTYYLQTNPAGYQTAGDLSSALAPYLLSATAATTYYPLVGNPSGFLTSAPVTSVAGMTGAVLLANTDISGLGTMATATAADYSTTVQADGLYYPLSGNPSAFLTDAPSDGSTYGRNNGAWAVAGGGYITSVTSPLSVTSNDLSVDLSAYLPLAGGAMTGAITSAFNGMESEMSEQKFKVMLTSTPSMFGELNYQALTISSIGTQMAVTPTGLTFPDASTQTTAATSFNPTGYATESWVYAGFYPLYGNPSAFLTDAPSDGTTYGRNNAAWVATIGNPPYSNSVWTSGGYVSATVVNIYDTGTSMYYNVLTF